MSITALLSLALASSQSVYSTPPVSATAEFRARDAAVRSVDPIRFQAHRDYNNPENLKDAAQLRIDQRDYKAAIPLLRKLAEASDRWALTTLAAFYDKGLGTEQDTRQAFALYLAAAEAGDDRSALLVGAAYDRGTGVTANETKARYWLSSAAKSSDADVRRDAKRLLNTAR